MCSLQDQKGFMWFGTKDGLNRFDGYSFKTFRRTAKAGSIGNNFIHALHEDRQGTIWVGTDQGLYQYMERVEEFRLAPATAGMYIDKVTEDHRGNLWFTSGFQLCRYNKRTGILTPYNQQQYFTAASFCISPAGTLLVGTSDGQLKQYHPETDTFTGIDLFGHSKTAPSRWIESLYTTADGSILAGTSNTEIKVIDPAGATYRDITLPTGGQTNLYIRSIQQTTPGEFWLGTESGVYVYNIQTGKCQHLKKDYNNPYSITDNAIYTFCRDREGGIWVGTYFGGLNYIPSQHTPFTKYYPQKTDNTLGGNVVREIQKDQYGNLWIGTEDAGLNKLEPSTGKVTHFTPDGTAGSISFFNIHGLLATGNELWVGTFLHGLDVMDIRTGKVIRHYGDDPQSGLPHNFVYCIYQTRSGGVLVGTPFGLRTYNRQKARFEPVEGFPDGDWYTAILQDFEGTVWTGTFGKGIHYYNPATRKGGDLTFNEKDPGSLSSNRVNSIFGDSGGNLWFATEEGLCKWDGAAKKFIRYGTANGFPSDFILSLLEDDRHNLWVSTTKGLVCFHPTSGKLETYTTTNGLLSDQFNYSSAFKDKGDRLYFGSAKGLVSFRPEEFSRSTFIPPVYITGFQVNGKDLAISQQGSLLKQSITYTKKLTLAHDQSTFSIDFAALDYTAPEMLQYTYQMVGLSNNWIRLKGNRRVDFIGLASGTYTFRVRAATSDGNWSRTAQLTLQILPPWWVSSWAYAAYALLALLLIFLVARYYHTRMKEKNRRKIERISMENEKEMLKMQLAKEKEILKAKVDFFTNVAHEIRTPLTLIKVPLRNVIKRTAGIQEIENSLKIMDRNTNRLIDLTNQLLDFRQVEMNKFRLTFQQAEITGLLAEACSGFTSLAEQNGVEFSITMPESPLYVWIDEDAFNKIVYNLLSNAVKYAQSVVYFSLHQEDKDAFTIRIHNDGFLIPPEMKDAIFEPFFRIRETESQNGTGIGLALARSLAELHGGTLVLQNSTAQFNTFTLTLPVQPRNARDEQQERFHPPAEDHATP